MTNNIDQIVAAARLSEETNVSSEAEAQGIVQYGIINQIGQTFERTERITQQIFVGDDLVDDDTISLLLVFGDAWIDAELVNRGIARDSIDPEQIVDQWEVLLGIGENDGLIIEVGDDSGGANSIIRNGAALFLAGIGLYKLADWGYKQHTEDDGETLWDAIVDFVGFGEDDQIDPVTGEKVIPETLTPNPRLDDLSNVSAGIGGANNVLVRSDETCSTWVEKQLIGPEVQEDDVQKATDTHFFNFEGDVIVTDEGDGKVTVTVTGAGGGEANTQSNTGAGAEVSKAKAGVDFPFRTLVGLNDVTITEQADTIEIDVTAGGGETNTGSNLGSGKQVFKQKTGVDFEHRTLTGANAVTLTESATEIDIDVALPGDGGVAGARARSTCATLTFDTTVTFQVYRLFIDGTQVADVLETDPGGPNINWRVKIFRALVNEANAAGLLFTDIHSVGTLWSFFTTSWEKPVMFINVGANPCVGCTTKTFYIKNSGGTIIETSTTGAICTF